MQRRVLPAALPDLVSAPAPRRAATRPGRRWLGAVGLAAAVPALALLGGFLWFLEAAAAVPDAPLRRTDGIVVLTGGGDRVPSGLALLVAGWAERVLVSGAHPDVTLADLAATSGQPLGALAGRVTLGRQARSTRGNAAETAAWARAERLASIRLVTAGYHMPRAVLELRRMLPPEVEVIAHPVVPAGLRGSGAAARARTWTLLCGEYAKLIGAALGLSRRHAEAAP
jgi:uncharacterized SAM-binding protein YcdF (DUF218 family)